MEGTASAMCHKVTDRASPTEPPTRQEHSSGDQNLRPHVLVTGLREELAAVTASNRRLRRLLNRHQWTCVTAFVTLQAKAGYSLATTPIGDLQWTINLGQVGGLLAAAGYVAWPYVKRLYQVIDPTTEAPATAVGTP